MKPNHTLQRISLHGPPVSLAGAFAAREAEIARATKDLLGGTEIRAQEPMSEGPRAWEPADAPAYIRG